MRLAAPILALALGGCAGVAFVHTDGQAVRVSFGLGAPRIDRGRNDAIAVRRISLGLYSGCDAAGVGLEACEEFVFDPLTCGFGIAASNPRHPIDHALAARIADQVRAQCPHATPQVTTKEPTP